MGRFKLLVFDVGGVVCDNTHVVPAIASHLELSENEFLTIARKAGLNELQLGRVTVERFWRNFSEIFGKRIEQDLWSEFFDPTPKPEMFNLIRQLKKQCRVVAATNTIEPHYRIHRERGHYAVFDHVYASHLIHLVKPQVGFFLHVLKNESVDPDEVFFVDDTIENVLAAQRLKIHSLLFTDVQSLKRELTSLGILF